MVYLPQSKLERQLVASIGIEAGYQTGNRNFGIKQLTLVHTLLRIGWPESRQPLKDSAFASRLPDNNKYSNKSEA